MSKTVEIVVTPVTRYVVTRYLSDEHSGSSETIGEFADKDTAGMIADALHQHAVLEGRVDVSLAGCRGLLPSGKAFG